MHCAPISPNCRNIGQNKSLLNNLQSKLRNLKTKLSHQNRYDLIIISSLIFYKTPRHLNSSTFVFLQAYHFPCALGEPITSHHSLPLFNLISFSSHHSLRSSFSPYRSNLLTPIYLSSLLSLHSPSSFLTFHLIPLISSSSHLTRES